MDLMKKRKLDDNGVVMEVPITSRLTIEDARKLLEPVAHDQILEILTNAVVCHPDVLDQVRVIADRDVTRRKLFVRGLGWETTTEKLRGVFGSYGELEEAIVINDKVTGKSKGYGFVTFKHVDGALMALKDPSKQIDGRMTVTQLASAGIQGGPGGGSSNNPVDVSLRKIYVANVPYDMQSERLLQHFAMYGEIEEGPLGFDKVTGKSKGYALFVYKTAESAQASLVDTVKNIDGHMLNCKLAIDGKKGGKPGVVGPGGAQVQTDGRGEPIGPGQYGGPSGITAYGGYPGHSSYGGPGHGLNSALGSGNGIGMGAPAAGAVSGGGYGPGIGGPYGGGPHFGGPGSAGYGALASNVSGGGGGYGGAGALGGAGGALGGAGGALGGAGRGSSMYGLPPTSTGLGSGDYPPQGSHYGSLHQTQLPAGVSPAPRVAPGGGMYQGMPSYY